MTRKQVIVQLDDDLVAELDRSAAADGISRSEALRRAARDYLDREWEREADRRYAQSYREHPPGWEWDDNIAEWDPKRSGEGEEASTEAG
ncbi:MAG: CopG family ribbon-helix-helix protein [Actinomycetota bacterium]